MYGMAIEQGWAAASDLVRERNSAGTRQCNADADFRHVLTMTGQSDNLDDPEFQYDSSGTACLDTVADFFAENNPRASIRMRGRVAFSSRRSASSTATGLATSAAGAVCRPHAATSLAPRSFC